MGHGSRIWNKSKILTSKKDNKLAGCLTDSRRILVTIPKNDRYKEQREAVAKYAEDSHAIA